MLQGVWNINFFCQSLKITSDILRYIRYSALKCHLAAAFCFIINVAWFIFSDLSSDAWAFSCVYTKRYIIYGQNSQSQEFQQNNLLKSCIGSLVESENCNRTPSPPDLAHCAPLCQPGTQGHFIFGPNWATLSNHRVDGYKCAKPSWQAFWTPPQLSIWAQLQQGRIQIYLPMSNTTGCQGPKKGWELRI